MGLREWLRLKTPPPEDPPAQEPPLPSTMEARAIVLRKSQLDRRLRALELELELRRRAR